ncbi:MAG: DUF1566 domain-containing protein [Deltaproteobacteria bacterium]|nr:DUF1566 domain-containing protein [Deltaproteobacteria bacterium]
MNCTRVTMSDGCRFERAGTSALLAGVAVGCLNCWSAIGPGSDRGDGGDGVAEETVGVDDGHGPDSEGWDADAAWESAESLDVEAADSMDSPDEDSDGGDPVPCSEDADCSGWGLLCNEAWGICVVASCGGQPDFTPCEVVTTPSDRAYDICVDEACVSPGCGDASCNAPGPNWTLPDTSQRVCRAAEYVYACPGTAGTDGCGATPYCGQDAQYGWDVSHASSERFTRSAGEEPVVRDNVTGLVWQGCLAGQTTAACEGFGSGLPWDEAVAYCDALTWGGFSDWGLPDRYELESIVDYGSVVGRIAVDETAFPNVTAGDGYSSSTSAESSAYAWVVMFRHGGAVAAGRGLDKTVSSLVRCVRRPARTARPVGPRFVRSEAVRGEAVVVDRATESALSRCHPPTRCAQEARG